MDNGKLLILTCLVMTVIASGCLNSAQEDPEENKSLTNNQNESSERVDDVEDNSKNRTVYIRNVRESFSPEEINVEKGKEITFVFNKTEGTHSLRIPELGTGTGTLTYESSENFTVTFDEEGEYKFECSLASHKEEGKIIVS